MLKGLDCYEGSDQLDFNKAKNDGYSFAICKATEGYTYIDHKFPDHYKEAHAAGLVRGAYCFSRPKTSTPEREAKTLIAIAEAAGGFELPAILDMEDSGGLSDGELGEYITKWREVIQQHDKRKPILYLNVDFYNRLKPYLDGFVIWIAEYGVENPKIEGWTFWQSTNEGKEQGGTFDFDYFNGEIKDLEALTIKGTAEIAKPQQPPAYKNDNAYHVIQNGETLSGIATKYHVPLMILARYNLISNPNLIQAGNKLRIPLAVQVRSGDTLTEIARRRNESISVLGYVNAIQNVNKIFVGQTIWV